MGSNPTLSATPISRVKQAVLDLDPGTQNYNDPDTGAPMYGEAETTQQATTKAQNTTTAQQQQPQPPDTSKQQPQTVVTMKIELPTAKIAPNQTETVAGFGVAQMDANGKITPPGDDEQHTITLTETLDTKKARDRSRTFAIRHATLRSPAQALQRTR